MFLFVCLFTLFYGLIGSIKPFYFYLMSLAVRPFLICCVFILYVIFHFLSLYFQPFLAPRLRGDDTQKTFLTSPHFFTNTPVTHDRKLKHLAPLWSSSRKQGSINEPDRSSSNFLHQLPSALISLLITRQREDIHLKRVLKGLSCLII